jgi:hypothetical protein
MIKKRKGKETRGYIAELGNMKALDWMTRLRYVAGSMEEGGS